MISRNRVKSALKSGASVLGTWTKIADPAAIEVLGLCGFDFTIIDREHVAFDNGAVTDLIRAAELADIVPIVRPRENRAIDILHALDAGALGVQVPGINTREQAEAVVRAAKYAPRGERGYALSHRAGGYGTLPAADYIQRSNDETLVVCYCESRACVENLDEITALDDVDVIFIGPFDLSQSLGVIGQLGHPDLTRAIDDVIARTRAAGKACGIIASTGAEAAQWHARGVQYVTLASDLGLMAAGARALIAELHQNRGRAEARQ